MLFKLLQMMLSNYFQKAKSEKVPARLIVTLFWNSKPKWLG